MIRRGEAMNDLLSQILMTLVAGIGLSSSMTSIFCMLFQKKRDEPDISVKIEKVSSILKNSSVELNDLQRELQLKIEFVNNLNMEVNQAQNLLSLSKEQINAIRTLLNQESKRKAKNLFG